MLPVLILLYLCRDKVLDAKYTGKATVFVSHAYSYPVLESIGADLNLLAGYLDTTVITRSRP